MRRDRWIAAGAIAAWYGLTWLLIHPLVNAPVADSWLYAASARYFVHTGLLRFAGYTDAMPVAQIVYGAGWIKLFGASYVALDLSLAVLGAAGAWMLYALAIRCGASRWNAAAATALLVCNPCYLFLSFSFMTEVPFLALMIGSTLAFAHADGPGETRWLWFAAALSILAFMVRPFGGAIAIGCAAAILLHDFDPSAPGRFDWGRLARTIGPFAVAAATSAFVWYWLTVIRPEPWDLAREGSQFRWIFYVSPGIYILSGIIGPALNLGVLTSPLSISILPRRRMHEAALCSTVLLAVSIALIRAHPHSPEPEFGCFGGWKNVLLLHGMPTRFFWDGRWRWVAVVWGSIGAGCAFAVAMDVVPQLGRGAMGVMLTAGAYWIAMFPLWLFADRYDLVLLPAVLIMLALAPLESRAHLRRGAAIAMTVVLGAVAISGVYDYQRGIGAVVSARDWLMRHHVRRRAIDAGYELNGEDLYRYPRRGPETISFEAGIPMITSGSTDEYTIAAEPLSGTRVIRRIRWHRSLGLGYREIYVLRRTHELRRRRQAALATTAEKKRRRD